MGQDYRRICIQETSAETEVEKHLQLTNGLPRYKIGKGDALPSVVYNEEYDEVAYFSEERIGSFEIAVFSGISGDVEVAQVGIADYTDVPSGHTSNFTEIPKSSDGKYYYRYEQGKKKCLTLFLTLKNGYTPPTGYHLGITFSDEERSLGLSSVKGTTWYDCNNEVTTGFYISEIAPSIYTMGRTYYPFEKDEAMTISLFKDGTRK